MIFSSINRLNKLRFYLITKEGLKDQVIIIKYLPVHTPVENC
jgi:hypothetical protein